MLKKCMGDSSLIIPIEDICIKDNLSFNTYNLARIDNNLLSSVINKINFEEFFENIDFFEKEKEKNKKIQDFGLFL